MGLKKISDRKINSMTPQVSFDLGLVEVTLGLGLRLGSGCSKVSIYLGLGLRLGLGSVLSTPTRGVRSRKTFKMP